MPWNGGDGELAAFFRSMIALRRTHAALRRGEYSLSEARDKLLVFERRHEEECLLVALNAGEKPAAVKQKGTVLIAKGLDGSTLAPFGWAVLAIG